MAKVAGFSAKFAGADSKITKKGGFSLGQAGGVLSKNKSKVSGKNPYGPKNNKK